MKKSLLLAVVALFATVSVSAERVTKEFTRAMTTEVNIEGDFRVVLSENYRNNVVIEYDDALAEHIVTEIKGKQLKVYYGRGAAKVLKSTNVAPTTIYIDRNFVSYTFSEGVTAASEEPIEGSELNIRLDDAACSFANGISTGKLTIKMTGASLLTSEISSRDLSVSIGGSSNAEISGVANKVKLTASGSAVLKASRLNSQSNVAVSASGSSSVLLMAKGAVKLSSIGSATITAAVDCKNLTISSSGSSQVVLSGTSKTAKMSVSGTARIVSEKYIAEMSANVSAKGAATVEVTSRGSMKISASGTSIVKADTEANLTVSASDTASVTHNPNAKLVKLTLKDQAIVKAFEEKNATVNFFASPQGFNRNHR